MTTLAELYRPREFDDVVGHPRAVALLKRLESEGELAGRPYWFAGNTGTGKNSLANIIAAKVADPFATDHIDASKVDAAALDRLERFCDARPLGKGYCLIVDEAHGLRSAMIRRLLVILEHLSPYVTVIFTTTKAGQELLFDDQMDAHPLVSRCTRPPMELRGLAQPFAEKAKAIAEKEGLDGRPIADYIRLAKECRNSLRDMLNLIGDGAMIGGAE